MTVYFRRFPATHTAATYAELRALPGGAVCETVTVGGRLAPNDGGEGIFVFNTGAAVDNGGTILVCPNGYWERASIRYLKLEWFGIADDADNTDAIQAAINLAWASSLPIKLYSRVYTFDRTLLLPNADAGIRKFLAIVGESTCQDSDLNVANYGSRLHYRTGDGTNAMELGPGDGVTINMSYRFDNWLLLGPDAIGSGTSTSGDGINLIGSEVPIRYPTIKATNFAVMGFGGGAGMHYTLAQGCVFTNVRCAFNGTGIYSNQSNANSYFGCEADQNYQIGALFEGGYSTTWSGGWVQGNYRDGLVLDGTSGFALEGPCHFEGNNQTATAGKHGIDIRGNYAATTNCSINGAQLRGARDTVRVDGAVFVPVGNVFRDVVASGPPSPWCTVASAVNTGFIKSGKPLEAGGSIDVAIKGNGTWFIDADYVQINGHAEKKLPQNVTFDAVPLVAGFYKLDDNSAIELTVTATAKRTGGLRATGAVGDAITFKARYLARKFGTGVTAATLSVPDISTPLELSATNDLTAAGVTVSLSGNASGMVHADIVGAALLTLQWEINFEARTIS